MKDQYFGDIRDLFKYDLIKSIIEQTGTFQGTSIIPMLTKYEERSDGNKRDFEIAKKNNRPGTFNTNLIRFLEPYKENEVKKRQIKDIGIYFKSICLNTIFYEGKDDTKYFENKIRSEYFSNVPVKLLTKSLIFIDPDIGLQIKKSTEKHLNFEEVKYLYNHMDENSILMIYQHFPRYRKNKEYMPEGRLKKLMEICIDKPIYISDSEIMFFFLAKNKINRDKLAQVISNYKYSYKNLTIGM